MKRFFFILFLLITMNLSYLYSNEISYKDPFLAGILSWVMPGTGQIYAKSYTKGSIFILGDIIDKSFFLGLMLHLNNKYKNLPAGAVSWPGLDIEDKGFLLGYLAISVGFKIYNSLDAVYEAKKYNAFSDSKVGFSISPASCNVYYSIKI